MSSRQRQIGYTTIIKYFFFRCSDPTELGTYLSALKCLGTEETGKCGGTQLPLDPTDDKTDWACDKCEIKVSNSDVAHLVNQIGDEVDHVQINTPTVRDLTALMEKILTFLHPNHYHVYAIKHSLIQLYGYQQGYLPNQITDELLKKKSQMCRELLDVTRKIDAGNARYVGLFGFSARKIFVGFQACFVLWSDFP